MLPARDKFVKYPQEANDDKKNTQIYNEIERVSKDEEFSSHMDPKFHLV